MLNRTMRMSEQFMYRLHRPRDDPYYGVCPEEHDVAASMSVKCARHMDSDRFGEVQAEYSSNDFWFSITYDYIYRRATILNGYLSRRKNGIEFGNGV